MAIDPRLLAAAGPGGCGKSPLLGVQELSARGRAGAMGAGAGRGGWDTAEEHPRY